MAGASGDELFVSQSCCRIKGAVGTGWNPLRLSSGKPKGSHVVTYRRTKTSTPSRGFQLWNTCFQGRPDFPDFLAQIPAASFFFGENQASQKSRHHHNRKTVPNELLTLVLTELLLHIQMVWIVPQHTQLLITGQATMSFRCSNQIAFLVLIGCQAIAIPTPSPQCFGAAPVFSCWLRWRFSPCFGSGKTEERLLLLLELLAVGS